MSWYILDSGESPKSEEGHVMTQGQRELTYMAFKKIIHTDAVVKIMAQHL